VHGPILTKRGFSRQIVVRSANVTFHEDLFSGRPVALSERTDIQHAANIRSSLLRCERALTLYGPSWERFVIPLPSRSLVHRTHQLAPEDHTDTLLDIPDTRCAVFWGRIPEERTVSKTRNLWGDSNRTDAWRQPANGPADVVFRIKLHKEA